MKTADEKLMDKQCQTWEPRADDDQLTMTGPCVICRMSSEFVRRDRDGPASRRSTVGSLRCSVMLLFTSEMLRDARDAQGCHRNALRILCAALEAPGAFLKWTRQTPNAKRQTPNANGINKNFEDSNTWGGTYACFAAKAIRLPALPAFTYACFATF